MKKYLDVLKVCPLFEGIDDENLLKMLICLGARVAFFDKKYTVIAEGNPARFIGIVLSGSVQIIQTDYYGNRSIVGHSEVSQVFGEAFACAEVKKMPVSIIANEPSEIMFIDCTHILHTCTNNCGFHQQLIFNMMKNLAVKNIQFHQKIEVTSKRSTREKLMAYLMLCAKKAGSNSFDIPFDRQELADFLGVERSGLSVEISKLKKEGIIDADKKHFELL
ncbi:MAG: Crp/Fnr family transcriptional regulator [Ruminococcus sp.]|nr:Crp/Fnr family transcriptional regulator [Ruminococcus sp.]